MSITAAVTSALTAATKPVTVNGALEALGKFAATQIGHRVLSEAQNKALHPLALAASRIGYRLTQSGVDALTDKVKEIQSEGNGELGIPKVSFDGFALTVPISDLQTGPTCGLESIENTIQLMRGDATGQWNHLADEMQTKKIAVDPVRWDAIEVVADDGTGANKRYWLIPPSSYPIMLKEYGVSAKLKRFSHTTLQQAMSEHRPVIVWGNVKYLAQYGGKDGLHAFVVTDWNPDTGKYTIMDSNYVKPYDVDANSLEKFATVGLPSRLHDLFVGKMCVCQDSARWPWKTDYQALSRSGTQQTFGGALGVSEMKHVEGTDLIAAGNRKIGEGKSSEGAALIRRGQKLIDEANREKAAARARAKRK